MNFQKNSLLRPLVLFFSLACLLCLYVPGARGQGSISGAIRGTVTDPTGAVVPGAEVTLTNTATLNARTQTTNLTGYYTFEYVELGTYNVVMKKEGFKVHTLQSVQIHPTEKLTVDAVLEVGSTSTGITVNASAVSINTESSATGGTIVGRDIKQILVNRQQSGWLALSVLVPGMNLLPSGHPVVNGLGVSSNEAELDGAYGKDNQTGVVIGSVPMDSIAEVQVLTGTYSARHASGGSGQFLAASKSGTREFHGSVYEYLRNNALDARNFFNPGKVAVNRWNNFGYSIGGPVYIPGKYNTDKKKTFFFLNQEWTKPRGSSAPIRGSLIPTPMRGGDFTKTPTFLTAFNPVTNTGGLILDANLDASSKAFLAAAHPGVTCVTDHTHLNPACFDPTAVAIINKYWSETPNIPGFDSGAQFQMPNYINPDSASAVSNSRWDNARIDHYFSEKLSLMARVSHGTGLSHSPIGTASANPSTTTPSDTSSYAWNMVGRLTWNITPTTINQVSYVANYSAVNLGISNVTKPSSFAIKLPFPNADFLNRIPSISISRGWAGVGAGFLPLTGSNGTGDIADDFTMVRGNHTLQVGMVWFAHIKRQDVVSFPEGSFSFSGNHVGDPVADFLLGLDSNFNQDSTFRRCYCHWRQFEAYFQDDWKVTPRLTLNLGVRDQYFSSNTATFPFSTFDPRLYDPSKAPQVLPNGRFVLDASGNPLTAAGTPAIQFNGIAISGQGGVPRGVYTTPHLFLQPRVGFAWDVFGNHKTSLRGGFGIGSSKVPFGSYFAASNPPANTNISLLNGTLADPAGGTPRGIKTPAGIYFLGQPGDKMPAEYIQTWSLTVERELVRGGILSVGYVGSGARNLAGTTDFNFPLGVSAPSVNDPRCLNATQNPAPSGGFQFDPCLNQGVVSPNFTRPFLGWGGMSATNDGATRFFGTSNYNALQAGFVYRGGHGLTLNVAYNWEKVLSNVSFNAGSGAVNAITESSGAQNNRNFRAEYGRPQWDRTHVLTFGYVYDLPFLTNRNDLLGKVAGGWAVSGITQFATGLVNDVGLGFGRSGRATRPNCVGGGVNNGPKTQKQWFNTTGVFAEPDFGFFGNCGRGLINAPGMQNWDTALLKDFRIGERVKSQFRAEAFNVFNHTNFNGLGTIFGASNFGQVLSALPSRTMEFALRFDF